MYYTLQLIFYEHDVGGLQDSFSRPHGMLKIEGCVVEEALTINKAIIVV
jgi:hypothetical protein